MNGPTDTIQQSNSIPNAICDLPKVVCDLPKVVCDLPKAVCDLPKAVCDLPKAVCDLPKAVCDLPKAVCDLPSINYLMVRFLMLVNTIVIPVLGIDICSVFKQIIVCLHTERNWKNGSLSWIPSNETDKDNIKYYSEFDFSSCIGKNLSIERQFLQYCNFSDVTLENVNIKDVELCRSNFSNSTITEVIFEKFYMKKNNFDNAVLTGCRFGHKSKQSSDYNCLGLVNIKFNGTQFVDCEFNKIVFDRCSFSDDSSYTTFDNRVFGTPTKFVRCKFVDCQFSYCKIRELEMIDCIFEKGGMNIIRETYFPKD